MTEDSSRQWRAEMARQSAVHDLIDEKRPREKRTLEYMAENPNGRRCSRCGEFVASARADVAACLCWRCTKLLAELHKRGYWEAKGLASSCPDGSAKLTKPKRRGRRLRCADCRALLPPERQRPGLCKKCRRKHRRESWRTSKKGKRGLSTLKASQRPENIDPNSSGRRPRGMGRTTPILPVRCGIWPPLEKNRP